MLPKWHILLGAIFTIALFLMAPETNPVYLALLFFASFLIDFDHYIMAVKRTNLLSVKSAFQYYKELDKIEREEYKKGLRNKGDLHIFHTVEFHFLLALLSYFWVGFLFIFAGMVFHSIIDLAYLLYQDRFYRREFFFFNWLFSKIT